MSLQVVYPRCAGLDLHRKAVVACRITCDAAGAPERVVRTFGTMTADLLALGRWLAEGAVTHVAMESTGVYWKPVFNLLEGSFELLLVNAQHMKAVPGRKTDVRDCEWLGDLLRHGLLKASFVPERPQRELRELTRYRTDMIRERAAEVNRIHKTLEGANLKLGTVASDVLGLSGRAILDRIVGGATAGDAAALAQLAHGKLRAKLPALEQALVGVAGPHQQFLLARQLAHVDDLEAIIAALDAELEKRLASVEDTVARLDAIPGVGRHTAEVIVAEVGVSVTRFPDAERLTAWAGLAPAAKMSAGKRKSAGTRKGNTALRTALLEAALAASRTKGTALSARYQRIAGRRGAKKAAIALARHILEVVSVMLRDGVAYEERGPATLDPRTVERRCDRLVEQLRRLGFQAALAPLPVPQEETAA